MDRLKLVMRNVVTGSNSCGKSNLYKSVHLLAKAATELITLASHSSQIWITTHSTDLAIMIGKASGIEPINLVRTDAGTQIGGSYS